MEIKTSNVGVRLASRGQKVAESFDPLGSRLLEKFHDLPNYQKTFDKDDRQTARRMYNEMVVCNRAAISSITARAAIGLVRQGPCNAVMADKNRGNSRNSDVVNQ